MMLWLLIALLLVAVMAFVLKPLLRPAKTAAPQGDGHLAVYADQLAEVKRDQELGLLEPAQAEAAEVEIRRHLIAAAKAGAPAVKTAQAPRLARVAALGLALAIPVSGLGLYALLGAPGLPDQPLAQRQEAARGGEDAAEIAAAIAALKRRLEEAPDNVEGWHLLGRALMSSERVLEAIGALRRARALAPEDSVLMGDLAEALVRSASGQVGPEAERLFGDALKTQPGDPRSRYYVALARAQAGDGRTAIAMWRGLAADSPPDAPWQDAVAARIAEAAAAFSLAPADIAPQRVAGAAPGPTAADVAAAQEMDGESQAAMIRAMVARLARRLEAEPEDAAGWLRLARSYVVLGERDQALNAIARAAAVKDAPAPLRAEIAALVAALNLEQEPAPPPATP